MRNNNPLNIRISSNQWQGKIKSNNAFENFSELKYGIRAGVKNLQTYFNRDKLNTVSKIINKWAPISENDTNNYIDFVSKSMGVKKDAVLSYESNTMAKLIHAMSIMELGKAYAVSENQVIETIKEFRLF